MVLERFECRLWELPARVYARPLELYPGLRPSPGVFEEALKHMRYLKVEASADLVIMENLGLKNENNMVRISLVYDSTLGKRLTCMILAHYTRQNH